MKKNMVMGIVALIVVLAAGGFWYVKQQNGASSTQTATTQPTTTPSTPSTSNNPYEGKTVSVDYIGTFPEGQVFDTSLADVAKKNGLDTEGRAYAPLTFVVGEHKVIPGFEKAVGQIKKVGDSTKVTIPPAEAYGEIDPAKIVTIDRGLFQQGNIVPTVGQKYQMNGQVITVLEVNEKTVKIDGNSPMAGKTLVFEVTLRDVK